MKKQITFSRYSGADEQEYRNTGVPKHRSAGVPAKWGKRDGLHDNQSLSDCQCSNDNSKTKHFVSGASNKLPQRLTFADNSYRFSYIVPYFTFFNKGKSHENSKH